MNNDKIERRWWDMDYISEANTKQDRLAKAAPVLLAACKRALQEIVELTDGAPEYHPDYLEQAIAKAEVS